MIRRPPRSTLSSSSAASDVYKRQKYVQQLEEISKSSKYCLGYMFKGQNVVNNRMKVENKRATSSRKFSTQEGLALVAAYGDTYGQKLQIFHEHIENQT